jgi:long-chain acyl-CoA synthetase
VYKASNIVANICVYATPDANHPIAIIFPHEVNLRHAVEDSRINKDSSLDELCHNEHVKTMVLKDLNAIGKKNGFRSNELLQAVILTPDEWTTQSGLLTAAQKIQRGPIARAFAKEIEVCQISPSPRCRERVLISDSIRLHTALKANRLFGVELYTSH